MKILLLGKTGQIGWELQRTLAPLAEIVAPGRETVDLARPATIGETLGKVRPAIVVNAAAYTAVDRAESEPQAAFAVNATAPRVLAEECSRSGALLVHYSTDYVFDGKKRAPYTEDDAPAPLNVYGKSKLEGELAIRNSGCRHLILRTSWVYGARGRNFLLAVAARARDGQSLRVVDDQIGAPTWCRNLAEATAAILGAARSAPAPDGVYHLSAGGSTSWYGFASVALERLGLDAAIEPVTSAQYACAAQRPAYSLLDNSKAARILGVRLPAWESALIDCLKEMEIRRD